MRFLFFFLAAAFLSGCFSGRGVSPRISEAPEGPSSIPNPREFSQADLNNDSLIDMNESAEFFESHREVDYITPLWAIGLIIGLVIAACSISSIRFFFKSAVARTKEVYSSSLLWVKKKFRK